MLKKHLYLLAVLAVLLILLFGLTGCSRYLRHPEHVGQPFVLAPEKTTLIKDLDKDYLKLVRQKAPVRIQGKIKYQCKLKGAWAFVDDGTSMVFIDFMASTQNIFLPVRQYQNPLAVEGRLVIDDTVLNNYHLIPYAYEYLPK